MLLASGDGNIARIESPGRICPDPITVARRPARPDQEVLRMNDAGQIGTGSAKFDAEQFSLTESEMLTHQRIGQFPVIMARNSP